MYAKKNHFEKKVYICKDNSKVTTCYPKELREMLKDKPKVLEAYNNDSNNDFNKIVTYIKMYNKENN